MGIWEKAKKADANYSAASWGPAALQFAFPTGFAAAMSWAASYRDWIWAEYGMLGALTVGLAGFLIASLAVYISGIGASAWRKARAPTFNLSVAEGEAATNRTAGAKNISTIQLEPSGEEMKLVVTPCRGQTTVQMFVDLSSWFPSHGWSQTARHYLGEMPLRSANVKFSLSVLGQAPVGAVGWFWKTLNSDGATSESHPWLIQCRQRATFVFIDATGTRDEFPFLLLPDPSTNADPVVITPDDLPIKTAP